MPRATCPNDPDHDRFTTTIHVLQEILVDKDGNFIDVCQDLEVVERPDPGNIWCCNICGSEADVE